MGKKSRRRDETKKGHSAAVKSQDCQRAHWPLHQGECLAIQEQLKRFVKLQSQVDALKALALSKGADQGMIDAAIAA